MLLRQGEGKKKVGGSGGKGDSDGILWKMQKQ